MAAPTTTQSFTLEYVKTIGMISNVARGRGFLNPFAIAKNVDGRIYVADGNLIRITICNFEEDYLGEFATWYGDGDGDQVMKRPSDMDFDSEQNLHVVDEHNNKVFVYTNDGEFLRDWGHHSKLNPGLNGACGIAFNSKDCAYVIDQHNHRIVVFSVDGEYLGEWGGFGSSHGEFNMPWGVTVDGEDHIYVVDWRNDRIQKFNSDGKFLDSFGESGVDDGQFNRPSKIAVDSQGNMYVADWGNERVQVLDPNGTFIQKLRGQATLTKWTEDFFESNIDERDTRAIANLYPTLPEHLQNPHSESAQTEPYFWGLRSLIVDDSDRLYVLESRRHRFQIYQKTPTK